MSKNIKNLVPCLSLALLGLISASHTASAASAATPLSNTVSIYQDWGTGYCANVTVRNDTGASVTWNTELAVDGTVYELWNALDSGTSGTVTFSGVDYNKTLAAGASTTFGGCVDRRPPSTAPVSATLASTLSIFADWGSGYCANITVKNTATTPVTWTTKVAIDGTLYEVWSAVNSGTSGTVSFTGVDYNKTLAAGASTTFGGCANRSSGDDPGGNSGGGSGSTKTIMPLGDSITGEPRAYRLKLYTLLTGENYNNGKWQYVGSQTEPYPCDDHGDCLPANDLKHEGHPGYTISGIAALTNGSLDTYKPQVVILQIGANDIASWQSAPVDDLVTQYINLVKQIRTRSPNTVVYAAELTPMSSMIVPPYYLDRAQVVQQFNAKMLPKLQALPDYNSKLFFLDHTLTTSDLRDGLHPNDTGYQKFAQDVTHVLK